MLRSERVAQKINRELAASLKRGEKLVVGIDGYAGSGKTTVADSLGRQNKDVLVVHLDDFIEPWQKRKELMDSARDKSKIFELKWYRYGEVEKLIKKFKSGKAGVFKTNTYDFDLNNFKDAAFDLSKKILVIDGIFLFHPRHAISKLWNKKIYLDVDFAAADKRRIAREKKRWGKDYVPETHPNSYVIPFKIAYNRYVKQQDPARRADLVFRI